MVDICSQLSTESVLLPERPEEPWTYENLESRKALPEEKEQGEVIHFAVVGFPVSNGFHHTGPYAVQRRINQRDDDKTVRGYPGTHTLYLQSSLPGT